MIWFWHSSLILVYSIPCAISNHSRHPNKKKERKKSRFLTPINKKQNKTKRNNISKIMPPTKRPNSYPQIIDALPLRDNTVVGERGLALDRSIQAKITLARWDCGQYCLEKLYNCIFMTFSFLNIKWRFHILSRNGWLFKFFCLPLGLVPTGTYKYYFKIEMLRIVVYIIFFTWLFAKNLNFHA